MADSNPRQGDWGSTMRAIYVFACLSILLAFLIALGVTGHGAMAIVIIFGLCLIILVTAGLRAGRHERDH